MCYQPIEIKDPRASTERRLVPCGKCIECRKKESRAWRDRIELHMRNTGHKAYFMTLTLNDDYYSEMLNEYKETGWFIEDQYIQFIQKMFKRLRKKGMDFKYYVVIELGELTERLHSHMLFITEEINKLELYWIIKKEYRKYYDIEGIKGHINYEGQYVQDYQDSLGFIKIDEATAGAIYYIVSYMKDEKTTVKRLISKGMGKPKDIFELRKLYYDENSHKYYDYLMEKHLGESYYKEMKAEREYIKFTDDIGAVAKHRNRKQYNDIWAQVQRKNDLEKMQKMKKDKKKFDK